MAKLLDKLDREIENFSIGLGYGIQNQLEGLYQTARHPVKTVKGLIDFGQQVVKDPSIAGGLLADTYKRGTSGLLGFGEVLGENLSPGMFRRVPTRAELITYHGSPHRINNVTPDAPYGKFDLEKVGTGEGAQAYGHGIYLAEIPEVAGAYRKTPNSLSRVLSNFRGDTIDDRPPGYLYTVDLPDEHIDKMLDWDAPLSEQPEAVRKALGSAGKTLKGPFTIKQSASGQWYAVDKTGEWSDAFPTQEAATQAAKAGSITTGVTFPGNRGATVYSTLSEQLGGDAKASEYLRSLGIPGIKYFDAGSRTAGEGTRNFVIFDPDKVKILKRE